MIRASMEVQWPDGYSPSEDAKTLHDRLGSVLFDVIMLGNTDPIARDEMLKRTFVLCAERLHQVGYHVEAAFSPGRTVED